MDRLAYMRGQRDSAVVSLMSTLKALSVNEKQLVCVFEGEDAKYYGSRINSFLHIIPRKNLPCNGKSKLIELKSIIKTHPNIDKSRVLFFADRDFDFDLKCTDSIYFTPCYSIENLYVSREAFETLISDEFGICSELNASVYEKTLDMFEELYSQFCEAVFDLNVWIYTQIKLQKENPDIKLNLNNFKITRFIDIDLNGVVKKYDRKILESTFKQSADIDDIQFQLSVNELKDKDKSQVIRGKYLIEFYRIFLEKLMLELNSKNGEVFDSRVKTKLIISDSNILSCLSQYATTPPCLKDFLSSKRSQLLAS